MQYTVTVTTKYEIYKAVVDGIDSVLGLLTKPDVVSYIVMKGDTEVTYAELASARRHPARQGMHPPLAPPL